MLSTERAKQVADMPQVKRWIRRLAKLSADMPPELMVFVGQPGSLMLMLRGYDPGLGAAAANRCIVANVAHGAGHWDGGDF